MRAVFGILGLVVVVAVVGLLAKKQLGSATAPLPAVPGAPAAAGVPAATPQQQVQQFEQALQGAMQQARPMPDEK
jgi:multidrug efflux pump subunit AcrB